MSVLCMDDAHVDMNITGVMNKFQKETVGVVGIKVFGDMLGEVFMVVESVQTPVKELYDSGCMNYIFFPHIKLVFTGLVAWTKKRPQLDQTAAKCNQTTGCGCRLIINK